MHQISIEEYLESIKPIEEPEPDELPCDTCKYDYNGCCFYDEPLGQYCVLGNAYEKESEEDAARKIARHFGKEPEFKNMRWRFTVRGCTVGVCYIPLERRIAIGSDIWCKKYQGGSTFTNLTVQDAITAIENTIEYYEKKLKEDQNDTLRDQFTD